MLQLRMMFTVSSTTFARRLCESRELIQGASYVTPPSAKSERVTLRSRKAHGESEFTGRFLIFTSFVNR
jgi:hypothetical protein